MLKLALYKGPPQNDLIHLLTHYLTKFFTWSKYSHSEIIIDGMSYSSSLRDGGVRKKIIDFDPDRWDIFSITNNQDVKEKALQWFKENEGKAYDYRNLVRYVLPFVGHNKSQFVCYEACGNMLGFSDTHKLTAEDLLEQALKLSKKIKQRYEGT